MQGLKNVSDAALTVDKRDQGLLIFIQTHGPIMTTQQRTILAAPVAQGRYVVQRTFLAKVDFVIRWRTLTFASHEKMTSIAVIDLFHDGPLLLFGQR